MKIRGYFTTNRIKIKEENITNKILSSSGSNNFDFWGEIIDPISSSVPVGTSLGQILFWNNLQWSLLSSGNEGDVLVVEGNKPSWKSSIFQPQYEYHTIFAQQFINGTNPPTNISNFPSENLGKIYLRKFSNAREQDVVFAWEVPNDLDPDYPINFKVCGAFTDSPEIEPTERTGFVFGLSAYSIKDGESIVNTFPDFTVLVKQGIIPIYKNVFISGWSSDINISDIEPGSIAMINFVRLSNNDEDIFDGELGVTNVQFRYVKKPNYFVNI